MTIATKEKQTKDTTKDTKTELKSAVVFAEKSAMIKFLKKSYTEIKDSDKLDYKVVDFVHVVDVHPYMAVKALKDCHYNLAELNFSTEDILKKLGISKKMLENTLSDIKSVLDKVKPDLIINATDYDVKGLFEFEATIKSLNLKPEPEIMRLNTSDMTKEALKEKWQYLIPEEEYIATNVLSLASADKEWIKDMLEKPEKHGVSNR